MSGEIKLEDLLDDYIKITQGLESTLINMSGEEKSFDKMSPFSMYVDRFISEKGYGKSIGIFKEFGITLVDPSH